MERFLLENLTDPQLVNKFCAFPWGFLLPLSVEPRHMSLGWAQISRVHALPHYVLKVILRLSSRLLVGLPNIFFSSGFPNEIQYSSLLSPILLHFKEYFTPQIHSSPLVLYTSLFFGTFAAPGRCVQGFGKET